jgi:lipopolysaccharide export system protein LptA
MSSGGRMHRIYWLLLLCISLIVPAVAQVKQDKIDLEGADVFEGGKYNGLNVHKFKGNVRFKQKGMRVFCDSAFQYPTQNGNLDAFGHVRIVQGDSVTITGNMLHYDASTKNATVKGNVVFTEKGTVLKTDILDYNTESKLATYNTGGVIRDGNSVLTSLKGTYNSQNKYFYFRNKVKVVGKDGTLLTDTLDYNTVSKAAYFRGPSQIINIDRVAYADKGEYIVGEAISKLQGRAKVESGSYVITGDQMYYDEKRKFSIITNNVSVISSKDSITIQGDIVHYQGGKGISKIFGNAIMKDYAEKDTLYLTADTLLSIDNNIPSEKRLFAYNNARIFRYDLQGKCDSLVYNFSDSTIYFNRDPVLWSQGSQMLADSINIQLANKKIDKLNMHTNAFIITLDTLKNFNQVKGKNMTAFFKDNSINKVDVSGNGESIYFALEKDSILTGMNKVICSDIYIRFANNKVSSITFMKDPDALFIPPHEIQEPERRLKGFRWRVSEKPTLEEVLTRRSQKKKI